MDTIPMLPFKDAKFKCALLQMINGFVARHHVAGNATSETYGELVCDVGALVDLQVKAHLAHTLRSHAGLAGNLRVERRALDMIVRRKPESR